MAKRDAKGPTGMNDAVHAAPALDWPFEMLRPGGSAVSPWVALHGPLVVLPDCGHVPYVEAPGAFVTALDPFLPRT